MNQTKTIFVSHAHTDREFARRVVRALSEALPSKIEFRLDADSVSPGDNLFVGIANALSKIDAMIVVVSEASESSAWVRSEVAWVLARREIPIFPILKGRPDVIPYLLRSRVYIDFSNDEKFTYNVFRLAEAILKSFSNSSDEIPILRTLELDFIARKKEILEEERLFHSKNYRILNVDFKSKIFFFILITSFSVSAASIISAFTNSNALLRYALAIIGPLVGVAVGFYLGRHSPMENTPTESTQTRKSTTLNRQRKAS